MQPEDQFRNCLKPSRPSLWLALTLGALLCANLAGCRQPSTPSSASGGGAPVALPGGQGGEPTPGEPTITSSETPGISVEAKIGDATVDISELRYSRSSGSDTSGVPENPMFSFSPAQPGPGEDVVKVQMELHNPSDEPIPFSASTLFLQDDRGKWYDSTSTSWSGQYSDEGIDPDGSVSVSASYHLPTARQPAAVGVADSGQAVTLENGDDFYILDFVNGSGSVQVMADDSGSFVGYMASGLSSDDIEIKHEDGAITIAGVDVGKWLESHKPGHGITTLASFDAKVN